jgi:hypothetical protein
MGNTFTYLKFDLQESQCRTDIIGKTYLPSTKPWIAIIYPRLRSLAYQNRKFVVALFWALLKRNCSFSFLAFRVYKRMIMFHQHLLESSD